MADDDDAEGKEMHVYENLHDYMTNGPRLG
jgi:hypothetical protein